MIRLLDLPGLPAIEARVRLNALTATRQDWELEHMVEAFIGDVLGVHGRPASILWDHGYRSAIFIDDDDEADNDDEDITDIESWRADGWDIVGEDGKELVCFPMISDAVECVQGGLSTRSKIDLEAQIWAARREGEAQIAPRDKARNQSFLQLGQRRRRGA